MAVLAIQTVDLGGLSPTYAAAGVSGDKVKPGERTFLHVRNGGGGSITVTVDDTVSVEPAHSVAFDPNIAVVIEPAGNRLIGPIVATRFKNVSDQNADITYSGVSSVTVAAIKLS